MRGRWSCQIPLAESGHFSSKSRYSFRHYPNPCCIISDVHGNTMNCHGTTMMEGMMEPLAERIASREPLEGGRPGPPRACLTDCTDVLALLGDGRPRSPWHHVWGAVAHSGLSFVERACAWRVLHGCVFTGALKRYVSMPVSPVDRFCTHSTCVASHYDTLSHVFLTCPLASQVWS